jgi:geranylgeranyl diphosphate synthase type II
MDIPTRIERSLKQALSSADVSTAPAKLTAAMHHAIFPGGARIRPRLCLAVAAACGDDRPQLSDASAAAIEILHCASLVHDDMPCFDDADIRRGKPTVHVVYGEPLAVLAGDALIVMAFEIIARAAAVAPARLAPLTLAIARSVGAPHGICAGQAWESEEEIDLDAYHLAKTGALFAGATMAGAASAGADPSQWRRFGERIGSAYQAADDIRDVVATPEEIGKPVDQDEAHHRPSLVAELGVEGAVDQLKVLIGEAVDSIPACPGREQLREMIIAETKRFLPKSLSRQAA